VGPEIARCEHKRDLGEEGRAAYVMPVCFFLMSTHKHLARLLIVVPRPMPAVPRRYLIVLPRPMPAAVVCYRSLIVVPRPLPTAPFLVRHSYLIVVPRLPAAPLAVCRTYLIVVLRPVPRALPAATRRCRNRRRTLGR
jgi:hypothetical protein